MQNHKLLIYILLSVFIILFSLLSFDGYYFYDDYSYSYYAYQLQNGTYEVATNDIFAHRWGIIAPLALMYYIFGVSDVVNVALPLIATLLSLYLVFKFIKNLDNKLASIFIPYFLPTNFILMYY